MKAKILILVYIVADARFLPIRSEVASTVIALFLLEHVPEWNKIISEAYRALKTGGLLIIQIPNLMYFIEPHTMIPLLGFLPNRLRTILLRSQEAGDYSSVVHSKT